MDVAGGKIKRKNMEQNDDETDDARVEVTEEFVRMFDAELDKHRTIVDAVTAVIQRLKATDKAGTLH